MGVSHSKATEAWSRMIQDQIFLWHKWQSPNTLLLVPGYKTCRSLIFIRCRGMKMDTKENNKSHELRMIRLKLSAPGRERKSPFLFFFFLINFYCKLHGLQHSRLPCPSPSPGVAQTHAHWVSDALQPSYPLSPPSPPVFNPSQHQGLFQCVSSSHQVGKVLEFQPQQQSFQ